ncbi:hypothetical protein JK358_33000 [Nocardia sp. 2]|uniref:Uncharacterized protein n=1 Tax=Nocardia acididurans TaxID=2802282 RepID=A0ABS1MEZ7_9NOCA|nr:hypothetical protein [Nocardia acididurans]MBL1079235.1 hypothetical protein [Nocardia acididurans]
MVFWLLIIGVVVFVASVVTGGIWWWEMQTTDRSCELMRQLVEEGRLPPEADGAGCG